MAAQPKLIHLEQANYLEGGGIYGWLTTIDHKRIAVLYGITALMLMGLGGMEAMMIRAQLIVPNNHLLSADFYNQIFTMHGLTMIFLVLMPLETGLFGNFFIPLQIGARDVAFPRLNALSYWIFLLGAISLNFGWIWGGLPNGGWFGYANLTERYYAPGLNIDFYDVGLLILGVSSVMSALNFFVTIVNMRAPGMTFMRMPMLIWALLVTVILLLLAFPALTVGLIFLFADRYFDTHFYVVIAGATPMLWQHLFWIFGHPEVYIMALPAFGMISEVLPVFSRKPLFGYPMMAYSIILIAFLSYGVWGHHMFATGMGPVADSAFSITSMLIAIPTGVKVFSWIATVWGGRLRFTTSMLFALGFILEFTIGGLSGVMHASAPVDLEQTDSYFIVAHFHYVLFGGVLMGILAAFYFYFPKISGRMMSEKLGKWQFWITAWAFNATFFPMHFLGELGMPRRIYTYAPDMGWNFWNKFESINAFILGFAFMIFFVNVAWSWFNGEPAGPDPWDARTLEWSIPSPPPVYNFVTVPTVHSRDAFWVQKYGDVEASGIGEKKAVIDFAPPPTPEEIASIHVPDPSLYPLLMAGGIFLAGIGMLVGWYRLVFLGLGLMIMCAIAMSFEYINWGEDNPHQVGESFLGLDNRKLGIWGFIGSECVFFASLISTYMVYKSRSLGAPDASILNIPLTSFSTFILLMSSLLMVLALAGYQRNDRFWGNFWLLGTAFFGLIFLGGQVFEFHEFWSKGMLYNTNLFSQCFYTLVGFHGFHVFIGVVWLVVMAIAGMRGKIGSSRALSIELVGLYWHFVDIVWVVIFTLIYLMRTINHA
ncbi:MAG: cytochrome c oxidase subunit I [Candidatus Binataceae bacterium]|nr:cytochrome c oxidase subunit I [Candidatus Binataceae bacterium]